MNKHTMQRMAENEVVFRNLNESIEQGFADLKKIAAEDGQLDLVQVPDKPLLFFCECADEDCTERIAIKPTAYTEIHKDRDQFVIKPGHHVNVIEQVISDSSEFAVVQKFDIPNPNAEELHDTPIANTFDSNKE